jgi:hypothetical protein
MRNVLICRCLLFVILLPAICCPTALAAEINHGQLDAIVKACIKLMQAGDFRGAAMMYHYPVGYTDKELEADLDGVEGSLQIFAEEFGEFGDVAPLAEAKLYVNIYASGGTHEYWGQQPEATKVELQTDFKNFGPGYLIIQVVEVVGTLEVKAIAFGLPVSGESVAKIRQVGDRMLLLMQEQQARTKAL